MIVNLKVDEDEQIRSPAYARQQPANADISMCDTKAGSVAR